MSKVIVWNYDDAHYLWHCGFDYEYIDVLDAYAFQDSFGLEWIIGQLQDIHHNIPTIILSKIVR